MEPLKIAEGVYQVGGPDMTGRDDCCIYLVNLGSPTLIDAGASSDIKRLVRNLEKVGCPPERIEKLVLTHAHIDHIGGAPAMVKKYHMPLYMHDLDAAVLEKGDELRSGARLYRTRLDPFPVKHHLEGDKGGLPGGYSTIHWIHTPGHTPGSISLWVEAGLSRVLFAQDVHGPFIETFGSDIEAWAVSMHGLIDLKADILCEGHFGIYQPASEVRRYIESYLDHYGMD